MVMPINPKLGKLPAEFDPRTPRLEKYLDMSRLPSPPAMFDYSVNVPAYGMHDNDRLGCCVVAAAANLLQTLDSFALLKPPPVPDDAVETEYSALSGYDPKTGANDNGVVMLNAMRRWRLGGLFGRKVLGYCTLRIDREDVFAVGTWLMGGAQIGAALPLAAQQQMAQHQPWDLTVFPWGRYAPGSWGGHAIYVPLVQPSGPTCITWTAHQEMTWRWVHTYLDEAYVMLTDEWTSGRREVPPGFDLEALLHDLSLLGPAA
jgi:hypothetical protein